MSLLNNYGCVLQNYALQTALKKIGHDPITLDYIPYKSPFRILLSLVYTIILFFTKRRRTFAECFPIKRDKYVTSFINKNICVTHPLRKYSSSLINEYKLEGFVVGSDQIWRPVFNDDIIYDAYLKFTSHYDVKRVAYAASFGVSKWEYNTKETKECSLLAKRFNAISVREYSGVELCKNNLCVEAKVVVDPTLLLEAREYRLLYKEGNTMKGKYLLSYILTKSKDKESIVKTISKSMSCKTIDIRIKNKLKYSIEEWLELFDNAECVVTDSFHGTVFSIIFHKKFIVIDNPGRGSARIHTLLKEVGLDSRMRKEQDYIDSTCISENIRWEDVDKRLEKARKEGVDFLMSALE